MAFLFLSLAQGFLDSLIICVTHCYKKAQHQCIQEAKATVCPQLGTVQVISDSCSENLVL